MNNRQDRYIEELRGRTCINTIIPKSHRQSLRFWLEFLVLALLMPFIYTAWEIKWTYGTVAIMVADKSEEEREAIKRIEGFAQPMLSDWQAWLLYPVIMGILIVCIILVLAVTLFYGVVELKNTFIKRCACSCED